MKFIIALLVALLYPSIAGAATITQSTMTWGGLTRTHLVYVPDNDLSEPMPIVMYLHGGGGNAGAAFRDGLAQYAYKYKFILVAPNGTNDVAGTEAKRFVWNAGAYNVTINGATSTQNCCGYAVSHNVDDVGYLGNLIKTIAAKYNGNLKLVYVTGLSNGAHMANRLACEISTKITAIAPVAGQLEDSCHPVRSVPVQEIHGTGDLCQPYAGGTAQCAPGVLTAESHSFLSAQAVDDRWAFIDKCSAEVAASYDHGAAHAVTHSECADGATVTLVTVTGMGHTYPSGNQYIDAELVGPVSYDYSFDQIWEFFQKFTL